MTRPLTLLRPLLVLGLLVLGAVTGLAATLIHRSGWGLVLGLAAAAVCAGALPAGGRRLAFVAGWLGVVVLALRPRPEGDYLIAADGFGYGLLAAAAVLFLTALVTLPSPGSGRGRTGDDREVIGDRT